ncbi:N-glycosyltransferase [Actinobacillus pleuropneumoniae]|nr:N-glycosyltransferase [Actinobacillus pleuropneumoniae]
MLVPAYNEELTIAENVRCLMTLNYPTYEVIVINDGSSDETLKVLIEEYGLTLLPNPEIRGNISTNKVRGIYYIRSTRSYTSLTRRTAARRIP